MKRKLYDKNLSGIRLRWWWNACPREQGRLTFRGLAIAMCLAMVGMAVMPLAVGDMGIIWFAENVMKKKVSGGCSSFSEFL